MRRTWLIFSQAVTVAVAVLFVIGTFRPQWLGAGSEGLPVPRVIALQGPAPVAASAEIGRAHV